MDAPKGRQAKKLGAYYTDKSIAEFLVGWAIRHPEHKVIDPSFGGGVFLEAAAKRLEYLGGSAENIFGIEVDSNVHAQISLELHSQFGINPHHLLQADFFDIEPKQLPKLDVVVGNPPFIRSQGFSGQSREKALHRAQKQGVNLNHLASSWAAFLIHAIAFLKKGGRLAMVAPVELGHANYAKPVLQHLLKSFGNITFVMFEKPLFPRLNQETLLILAEDKGQSSSQLSLQYAKHIETLANHNQTISEEKISAQDLLENDYALSFYTLPKRTQELYIRLASSPLTQRLGDVTHIGIGYVTGANPFFHLSKADIKQWNLSKAGLKPAVYKSRAFQGLSFNKDDWKKAEKQSDAGFLLHIQEKTKLSEALQSYLNYGEQQNIHQSYKCRMRSPWYSVPHVYNADAFLSYMSGHRALLVANHTEAVAPNTLHVIRLKTNTISADDLSVLWQNSLTMLSTEIEGHTLGGGLLKLEPSEAKQVLIPRVKKVTVTLRNKLDTLLRQGNSDKAIELGNQTLLIKGLGLSKDDVATLVQAIHYLQQRRNK